MFEGIKRKLGWRSAEEVTMKEANNVVDINDTIHGIQFMVNTIYDICQSHGTDVNNWTLTDMSKIVDVFTRLQKLGKEG